VGDVASMAVDGATYAHGTGNMCATCHQARRPASEYDKYDVATTVKLNLRLLMMILILLIIGMLL
jgi:hypothetical protein